MTSEHSEIVFEQYEGAGPRRTWHETGSIHLVQLELYMPGSVTIASTPSLRNFIIVDDTVRSHTTSTTHIGRAVVERHDGLQVPVAPSILPFTDTSEPSE